MLFVVFASISLAYAIEFFRVLFCQTESPRLTGYVALITGAASGLGKAIAERFVHENAAVFLADLKSSDGANVAKMLNQEAGNKSTPSAIFCPTDVSSEKDVMNAMKMCKEKFGKLNVVVNSAGTFNVEDTFDVSAHKVHSLETFKRVIDVNLVGTFNVCRLASELMSENNLDEFKERGVIINISSISAVDGPTTQIAYTASKAGISGMTLPMARDLADIGIRVVALSPGPFETAALSGLIPKDPNFKFNFVYPKRIGKPEELASLAVEVVTNKMLNGVDIRIAGGLRL